MMNKKSPAFFVRRDDLFMPNQKAASAWDPNHLGGTAVCAMLAHELESRQPERGFVPTRFTADLFRPVLNSALKLRSEILCDSKRIRVVSAEVIQNDEVRARGTVQFLRNGQPPTGQVWEPKRDYPVPIERLDAPEGSLPLFKFGNGGWTADFNAGANALRKSTWVNVPPLIEGDSITAFERAAFVADFSNLLGNWGTTGIGYINTDVTLTMARLPLSNEIGMQVIDHVSANGISACTTRVYDREGPIGACVVTGISNADKQVDVASAYEMTHVVRDFG